MKKYQRFPRFRYMAWLSAGVVSVVILMNLSSFLVLQGLMPGGAAVAVFTLLVATALGVIFCRKASFKDALILSAVIALYYPALYAAGWGVAFLQDLIRADGIPGDSLEVMMALRPRVAPYLVVLMVSLTMLLGSRIYQKIFKII